MDTKYLYLCCSSNVGAFRLLSYEREIVACRNIYGNQFTGNIPSQFAARSFKFLCVCYDPSQLFLVPTCFNWKWSPSTDTPTMMIGRYSRLSGCFCISSFGPDYLLHTPLHNWMSCRHSRASCVPACRSLNSNQLSGRIPSGLFSFTGCYSMCVQNAYHTLVPEFFEVSHGVVQLFL